VVLAPPKTKHGNRSVPLPNFVAELLQRQRLYQADLRCWAAQAGSSADSSSRRCSGRRSPTATSGRRFRWLLKLAGLPPIRPHDLRHGAASLWFALGVPAKTVSKLLGHANVSITLDLYTHVSEELEREAADQMNNVLQKAGS